MVRVGIRSGRAPVALRPVEEVYFASQARTARSYAHSHIVKDTTHMSTLSN